VRLSAPVQVFQPNPFHHHSNTSWYRRYPDETRRHGRLDYRSKRTDFDVDHVVPIYPESGAVPPH